MARSIWHPSRRLVQVGRADRQHCRPLRDDLYKSACRCRRRRPTVLIRRVLLVQIATRSWAESVGLSRPRQERRRETHTIVLPEAIKEAIEAMERFAGMGKPTLQFQRYYALLCEFAHPNAKGARHLVEVLKDSEDGWLVQYRENERLEDVAVDMAVSMLAKSMRVGHAASELLRLCDFRGSATEFGYQSASESEMERIWVRIIQRPLNRDTEEK